ncbi:hypothetical protein EMPS_05328 [Entomortierella parvispora]|uniref:F-box domain-containing protein n=1 Tax=Entomortierella parvispora TaxID=205924 RepID=A0A9P3LWM4_9FUNG|nr:hypothetical protein EMPS_05328 [Entomortierella parvispora]
MHPSAHPLWQPEIQSEVAQYLDNASLAAASAVCRDWNVVFPCFLYKNADLDNKTTNNHISLSNHAKLVRNLNLYLYEKMPELSPYLFADHDKTNGFVFDQLTSLNLKLTEEDSSEPWSAASLLVRRNSKLENLQVSDSLSATFLRAVSESCPCLKKLSLRNLALDREATEALVDLCSANTLVSLILDYVTCSNRQAVHAVIQGSDSPELTQSLKLQVLKFTGSYGVVTLANQIAWAQRCPQLKTLELYCRLRRPFPAKLLCEALPTTLCEVNQLRLSSVRLTPDDLAVVLEGFGPGPRIKYFGLGRNLTGPVSWPPTLWSLLERHKSVLTHLDMKRCPTFSSDAVQLSLATFPRLVRLQAGYLIAQDILGNPNEEDEVTRIVPWVCKGLRHLDVHIHGFDNKPALWNVLVLKQLSTLEVLETLDIRMFEYSWHDEEYRRNNSLDLRLEAGLRVLASLTRMKRLDFVPELQRAGTEELEWMEDAWPEFVPSDEMCTE